MKNPSQQTQQLFIAESQYKKKQYGIALEMFQKLKHDGYTGCALKIGNCYHHLGYYALALEQYENTTDYKSFIESNRDLSQYHLRQIDCYDKLQDWKALERFKTNYQNDDIAMGIKYKDVIIPYINGILQMKKHKNFEQARIEFTKSQRLPFSQQYIAILDKEINDIHVKEALLHSKAENDCECCFELIEHYLHFNKLDEASETLHNAMTVINKNASNTMEEQQHVLKLKGVFYRGKIDYLRLLSGSNDVVQDNVYKTLLNEFVKKVNTENSDFAGIKGIFIEAHEIICDVLNRMFMSRNDNKAEVYKEFMEYLKTKKLKIVSSETHFLIKGKVYCNLQNHQNALKNFRKYSASSGKLLSEEIKEMKNKTMEEGQQFKKTVQEKNDKPGNNGNQNEEDEDDDDDDEEEEKEDQ